MQGLEQIKNKLPERGEAKTNVPGELTYEAETGSFCLRFDAESLGAAFQLSKVKETKQADGSTKISGGKALVATVNVPRGMFDGVSIWGNLNLIAK